MINWDMLLCEERIRKSQVVKNDFVTRNEFEADYDRIVGSSSVRRLQDKAQVFPLQKNDVVRTRLTHSIEVSAIARSLAKTVGLRLERKNIFDREKTEKLMGMLQTAGLIHDLGNPPFGHYGEKVIRKWYENKIVKKKKDSDSHYTMEQQDADFVYFDGNVQNLRIITKLQTMNDQYGVNFTYGTLAAVIKYPYSSMDVSDANGKFGYFKSEEDIVKDIWEHTGLQKGIRHPATYLLEAADDIVYICDDIEDGVKKGYIPWAKEYENLKSEFEADIKYKQLFKSIDNKKADEGLGEQEILLANVRLFRNYIQGYLMKTAIKAFFENYNEIMNGSFGMTDLLKEDDKFIKSLKDITAVYCFSCDEVLTLEIVGERTIKELLDIFYDAIHTSNSEIIENTGVYEGKIYHLISDNYKYILKFDYENNRKKTLKDVDDYEKMHLIVDFIAGMTDSYAVSLYKKLLGISLPE